MLNLLKKSFDVGVITENIPLDEEYKKHGEALKRKLNRQYNGSIAIRFVDSGSCNGCELEIHALNNPFYDAERYGIHFVASPRHADVLLVTGAVSKHMAYALKRTYEAMPSPKWVVASGDCAACGGEYGESYALVGSVEKILPVDMTITGCPPNPLQLIKGLLALLDSATPEESE